MSKMRCAVSVLSPMRLLRFAEFWRV